MSNLPSLPSGSDSLSALSRFIIYAAPVANLPRRFASSAFTHNKVGRASESKSDGLALWSNKDEILQSVLEP